MAVNPHDAVDIDLLSVVSYRNIAQMVLMTDKYSDDCYEQESFNKYENKAYHWMCSEYIFQKKQGVSPVLNDTSIKRFNAFSCY